MPKQYLWEAAKIIYGEGSAFVAPWVKERETLLLDDQVEQVIAHLQRLPGLRAQPSPPFCTTSNRIRTACAMGPIGSRATSSAPGAIESAGKQLAAGRIKGPGMRWNVTEVNALLKLRCVFLEQSWQTYWETQGPLAA